MVYLLNQALVVGIVQAFKAIDAKRTENTALFYD
jgi:hypothetical protein